MLRPLVSLIVLSLFFISSSAFADARGEMLFGQHCVACHQFGGKGGIGLPLTPEKMENVDDLYLIRTIQLGRPGRVMPAFTELNLDDVRSIVDYMRSASNTKSVVFEASHLSGNPDRGEGLYHLHCVTCHAEDGSGAGEGTGVTLSRHRGFMVMPPSITNPGFLASASDPILEFAIKHGREGSGMLGFKDVGLLDEQGVADVVAYIRQMGSDQQVAPPLPEDERPTITIESPYDFDTTVSNVRQSLVGANFRIFPDRYLEQGLLDEFMVNKRQIGIRFCNFNELYGMLAIEPRVGTVLPCRITILEQEDGTVLLVAPNLKVVSRWFNNDNLVRLWAAMNEGLNSIMEEASL